MYFKVRDGQFSVLYRIEQINLAFQSPKLYLIGSGAAVALSIKWKWQGVLCLNLKYDFLVLENVGSAQEDKLSWKNDNNVHSLLPCNSPDM